MCQKLIAVLKQHKRLVAKLNKTIIKLYPETEELTIMPSSEEQTKEGLFSKVTVAGDSNLLAENIKKGVNLFGVEGTGEMSNIKITNASYLFYNGARINFLEEILSLCKNVTGAEYMFSNCKSLTSLDLSGFDTSNVTSMTYMFNNCINLTSIDVSNFNTSNVTNMSSMFDRCKNLTSIDVSKFDTSNAKSMYCMFNTCSKLEELDLSSFDMSKVNTVSNMFYNCNSLKSLKSFKNLGKSYTSSTSNYSNYTLDLSTCTSLTYESLIDILTNGLYDLNLTYDTANNGTLRRQSLVLGETNLAKLTEEEIAIATGKGWNVS